MKQSQAVINAVYSVCGKQTKKYVLSTEDRKKVIDIVTHSILEKETVFSDKAKAKYSTPKLVREYTAGMVSNHLRKATELNGGVKYVPANPGLRAGSSDPEIKNLKLLIKSGRLTAEKIAVAEEIIATKIAKLKASKAQVEIDFTAIPADLLESLGIND